MSAPPNKNQIANAILHAKQHGTLDATPSLNPDATTKVAVEAEARIFSSASQNEREFGENAFGRPKSDDDFTPLIESLAENGLAIDEKFLSRHDSELVLGDLLASHHAGRFRRAGIGRQASHRTADDVRRDEVFWFDPENLSSTQQVLWSRLTALQQSLNQNLFLGLRSLEGHYAFYPPGGFYRRHLDRFRSDDTRAVTIIIYLNSQWQQGDGGELKVYLPNKNTEASLTTKQTYLIQPKAGTLVLFLSDMIEHEVIAAHKNRFSFAGWYKRAKQPGVPFGGVPYG